jgi:hypothetical protein
LRVSFSIDQYSRRIVPAVTTGGTRGHEILAFEI